MVDDARDSVPDEFRVEVNEQAKATSTIALAKSFSRMLFLLCAFAPLREVLISVMEIL
ncbi:hypothetical protein [Lignipirellula cremea]|uniref:Uncharacterized protein n=1 Tax=Lignipirellula cremea TaxID=2528010 RepID=A0A518DNV4_9BACT|nr:hypothetical protein [Lignipirellula cremea]QDU93519.1 hypothetical protein Pla8534_12990 [Lignipirellula cremea]